MKGGTCVDRERNRLKRRREEIERAGSTDVERKGEADRLKNEEKKYFCFFLKMCLFTTYPVIVATVDQIWVGVEQNTRGVDMASVR